LEGVRLLSILRRPQYSGSSSTLSHDPRVDASLQRYEVQQVAPDALRPCHRMLHPQPSRWPLLHSSLARSHRPSWSPSLIQALVDFAVYLVYQAPSDQLRGCIRCRTRKKCGRAPLTWLKTACHRTSHTVSDLPMPSRHGQRGLRLRWGVRRPPRVQRRPRHDGALESHWSPPPLCLHGPREWCDPAPSALMHRSPVRSRRPVWTAASGYELVNPLAPWPELAC
jgi:hypothetical protein